jgi:mannosyltransferase
MGERTFNALLAAILVLAAALRLTHLGSGLWYDEIETLIRYARPPFSRIVTTFDSQNQHMLYSLSAHASLRVLGDGARGVRFPAAVFGVLSLWALARIGVRLTTRREALLATLLLAVSYHHVWFSQDARGYTALMLWTLLSTDLFIRLLERAEPGGLRLAVAYAVTMALGLYTHLTAAFVLAAHGLIWLAAAWRARARLRERGTWLPLLACVLAALLAALLYAPVMGQAFGATVAPTMQRSGVAWQRPGWLVAEALRGLSAGVPGGLASVALALVVAGAGVLSYARRSPWRTAAMILPGVVTAAALALATHNLWPRFFFFLAGFAVLMVVRGGFDLAGRVLPARGLLVATWVTAAVAALSLTTVPRAWAPKQDFDGARAWIEQARGTGDAVVVVDMTRLPYQADLGGAWQAVDGVADLAAVEAAHPRTWVAYTFPARLQVVQPELWQRLEREYRLAREFPATVGGGAIVIKVKG